MTYCLKKWLTASSLAHSADRGRVGGVKRCRVPIVLIDRDYQFPNVIGRVLVDNKKASFTGVNYLIDQGYWKIAYIAGFY